MGANQLLAKSLRIFRKGEIVRAGTWLLTQEYDVLLLKLDNYLYLMMLNR